MKEEMTDPKMKAADIHCKEVGDDCLCQRTVPGTPVGEHIYCFCGCRIHDAVIYGWDACLESLSNTGSEFDEKNAEMMAKELYKAPGPKDEHRAKLAQWIFLDGARYQHQLSMAIEAGLKAKIQELEAKLARYEEKWLGRS